MISGSKCGLGNMPLKENKTCHVVFALVFYVELSVFKQKRQAHLVSLPAGVVVLFLLFVIFFIGLMFLLPHKVIK